MVSPKTLVENPWPWLGRFPEYVRQHTGLSTSGRGPVPPGPPWPSVTLSYHPGPLSFSVTALALHHSRSPPWPSVALGYRPGPPSLSPSVALGHRPGPPLSIALSHRPGPLSLSAITLALHCSRSPPRPSIVRRSRSPPWPSVTQLPAWWSLLGSDRIGSAVVGDGIPAQQCVCPAREPLCL